MVYARLNAALVFTGLLFCAMECTPFIINSVYGQTCVPGTAGCACDPALPGCSTPPPTGCVFLASGGLCCGANCPGTTPPPTDQCAAGTANCTCDPTLSTCAPPPPPTCQVVCTPSTGGCAAGTAGCNCAADGTNCGPQICQFTCPDGPTDNTTIASDGTSSTGPNPAQTACGHPVNISSGAMFDSHVDFLLTARTAATAISIKRTYLAIPTLKTGGDFGPGWSHNWEQKLIIQSVQNSTPAPSALDNFCATANVSCSASSSGAPTGGGAAGGAGGSVPGNCGVIENKLVCLLAPPTTAQLDLFCSIPSVSCTHFSGTPPTPQPANCKILPGIVACVTPSSGTPPATSTASNIILIDESGAGWRYARQANNSFATPPGLFSTLTEFSDRYELRRKDGIKLIFSRSATTSTPAGALLSLSEPHGEAVTLAYSLGKLASLSTGLAGTVTFTRDATGRVIRITRVRDSLAYTYNYNAGGNLESAVDFEGRTIRYEYTTLPTASGVPARTLLSAIEDPIHRRIEFTYYDDGRAHKQTEPGNGRRTFTYATGPTQMTQMKDIDGRTTTFNFDSAGRLIQTQLPDGAITRQEWTPQNQVAASVDQLGFRTEMTYDNRANMTGVKKPEDPGATLIAYETNFGKPIQITPLVGSATNLNVNPTNGDVTSISRTDEQGLLSLNLGRDVYGNAVAVDNGLAQYSNATNADGLLTLAFDTRNPETRNYDSRGRVSVRSFATGRRLTYVYDNYDHIVRVSDSHGPALVIIYDIMGRMLSRTVASGTMNQTTRLQWDDRDRLVAITDPAGRVTRYEFDRVAMGCGVIDKPARIIDPAGRITALEYDVMQRLIKKTAADGTITSLEYNLRGDNTALIDAKGQRTSFFYDGNQRLVKRERPSVVTSSAGVTTATIEITLFKYDLNGKLVREEQLSSNSGFGGAVQVTQFTYDRLDRLTRKVLKRESLSGAVLVVQDDSSFSYSRQLDTQRLTTAYNGVEQLSFGYENAPPFANTSYQVKAAASGNPLKLQEGTFEVGRDQTGQIGGVALSGSSLFSADYDPAGRMIAISSNFTRHGLSAAMTYDGFGRREAVHYSNGLEGTRTYDILNRLTAIGYQGAREKPFNEALAYDTAGNITSVVRELGVFQYSYDQKNQLVTTAFEKRGEDNDDGENDGRPGEHENSKNLLDRNFGYDEVGNRIADNVNGAATFINNFLVQNTRYLFTADADGSGNVISKRDRRTGRLDSFSYRADKKLTLFTRQKGNDRNDDGDDEDCDDRNDHFKVSATNYYFDALGRRVAKVIHHDLRNPRKDFTQSFTYLSDQDKILLSKNGEGELTLYLDGRGIDEHLGHLGPRGVTAYITDHLGTVINGEALGKKRAIAAFGESLIATAHADNGDNHAKGTSISRTSDPAQYGFAGRTLDLESGLYFNRARMYDPSTGRFMSHDPVWPRSGINPYTYVSNNPLLLIDPSGKFYQWVVTAGAIILVTVITVAILDAALKRLPPLIDNAITTIRGWVGQTSGGCGNIAGDGTGGGRNLASGARDASGGPSDGGASGGESGTDPNTSGWYDDIGGGGDYAGGPMDAGGASDSGGGSGDYASTAVKLDAGKEAGIAVCKRAIVAAVEGSETHNIWTFPNALRPISAVA